MIVVVDPDGVGWKETLFWNIKSASAKRFILQVYFAGFGGEKPPERFWRPQRAAMGVRLDNGDITPIGIRK